MYIYIYIDFDQIYLFFQDFSQTFIYTPFYKEHFSKQHQAEIVKKKKKKEAKSKQHPQTELLTSNVQINKIKKMIM